MNEIYFNSEDYQTVIREDQPQSTANHVFGWPSFTVVMILFVALFYVRSRLERKDDDN